MTNMDFYIWYWPDREPPPPPLTVGQLSWLLKPRPLIVFITSWDALASTFLYDCVIRPWIRVETTPYMQHPASTRREEPAMIGQRLVLGCSWKSCSKVFYTRDTREGWQWPLLTVKTEANGVSRSILYIWQGVIPWLVCGACHAGTKDFCPALL